MKNIECKEYQLQIIKLMQSGDCGDCPLFDNDKCVDDCAESLLKDMNSEYVEPRHWETWELEMMQRISNMFTHMELCSVPDTTAVEAFDCNNKIRYRAYLPFKMPTLEKNEIVDIDEALKANGMSR